MEVDEENLISSIIQAKSKVEELRNDIGLIINTIIKKKDELYSNDHIPKRSELLYSKHAYAAHTTDNHVQKSPMSESRDRKRRTKTQREPVLKKPRKNYSAKPRHSAHEDTEKSAPETDVRTDPSD